ncbi:NUDIX hydrolase [Candidatus Bathyarchaeota archaeon]|nr:NUDIX hydrolase [Candidatus Bathyarchaeota archaeon]
MPIPSVEAMITKGKSLLLLKRKNSPAKGEWWFPGGRIWKGETFEETLHREVKEETALAVDIVKCVGVYNRIFPDRHDITIVFLCRCCGDEVILNEEHSEYQFFRYLPANIYAYLLETIKDSGWKQS